MLVLITIVTFLFVSQSKAAFNSFNFFMQPKLQACGMDTMKTSYFEDRSSRALLASSSPCDRYSVADEMVKEAKEQGKLSCINVAREFLAVEKNFFPGVASGQAFL